MEIKALGRFVVIEEVEQKKTMRDELMGSKAKDKELRYLTAKVLAIGTEAEKIEPDLTVGDMVMYDKHAAHSSALPDRPLVLRIEDIAYIL